MHPGPESLAGGVSWSAPAPWSSPGSVLGVWREVRTDRLSGSFLLPRSLSWNSLSEANFAGSLFVNIMAYRV